jgi:hypothetical protein
MTLSLTHTSVATGTDNPDKQVSKDGWNAEHQLNGTAHAFVQFDANGSATEASPAEVALVDAATIAPDFSSGFNFSVTLGGNRTLANPSNATSGHGGTIFVTQDGTGSRTLNYGTNWKFPSGDGTLSTAPNSVDAITYYVRANGTIACVLVQDFS